MTEKNNPSARRRPGPISFQAESKITSLKMNPTSSTNAIGTATEPKKETAAASKELKVQGPIFYFFIGLILIVTGIFVSGIIALIGLCTCIASLMTNKTNKTRKRLRNDFDTSTTNEKTLENE
jgi:hypothetical protein